MSPSPSSWGGNPGQAVNFVAVNRPLGSIDCSYVLDPSLHIPARFLPPLEAGRSEEDRKNLVLKSRVGTIVANITLYHQEGASVTKRTSLEFKTTVGTMILKIDAIGSSIRPPLFARAITNTGTVLLSLPRSFRGFVSVSTTIGAVTLSRDVTAMCRWITNTARIKKCFIGDPSGLTDAELDSWNGDEVEIETTIGSVDISYVAGTTNPGLFFTPMMRGVLGIPPIPGMPGGLGQVPPIPAVPGLRGGFGAR
ncbi:hypothetical protein Moror_10937 [Moniliophthora roreri MCA 2997]|uniref:DUF7330 domain-containing protein n=1 Tax=Moniliophthora roreri (strain MCA 2997) TaxID=1381753 RepID=V2X2M6_MONRO|nr:hypothetical protein Moror_10937 [Moniliophthora roreri MCA 2997]